MPRICVIEINDAGLTAADQSGVRLVSPGYAVLDGDAIKLGQEALARLRLNPRRSFDRFWDQLDQQPLARSAEPARSHADLAYFQLRAIWDEVREGVDEVVLAVPATFDKTQLSLLLGIARACEMPVTGLVESSLAAAAWSAGERPRLYLDAQLHRLLAARIDCGDGLVLQATEDLARQGLAALRDAWVEMIAECFLRQTRFDPLHRARGEQMLYDCLPEWLAVLRSQRNARLDLRVGSRVHRISLTRAELVEAAAEFYRPLADAAAAAGEAMVLLSHRLAELPGLTEAVAERAGTPLVALPPEAVTQTVLAYHEFVRSDDGTALAFVTRLPGPVADATPPPTTVQAKGPPPPTHVLHGWRAYPIDATPLVLEADAPHSPQPGTELRGCIVVVRDGVAWLEVHGASGAVRLNGQAVTGEARLAVGDRVQVGDEVMRLIAQVDAGGSP